MLLEYGCWEVLFDVTAQVLELVYQTVELLSLIGCEGDVVADCVGDSKETITYHSGLGVGHCKGLELTFFFNKPLMVFESDGYLEGAKDVSSQ